MKKYLQIFLILNSLFIFACAPGKGYTKTLRQTEVKSLLSDNYSQALYRANISFYKKQFSGLVLFNYKEEKKEHYIVFLSEMGLSLLEFKYKNGKMETMKRQPFFDKKAAIETFKSDFELLVQLLPLKEYEYYEGSAGSDVVKRKKGKSEFYYLNDKNDVVKLKKRKNALMSVEVSAKDYTLKIPQEIEIKHKGLKLQIDLRLLKKD